MQFVIQNANDLRKFNTALVNDSGESWTLTLIEHEDFTVRALSCATVYALSCTVTFPDSIAVRRESASRSSSCT